MAKPLMDEEAFVKHACVAASTADFGNDHEEFARHLWRSVQRLAESAWDEGRAAGKKSKNPYK